MWQIVKLTAKLGDDKFLGSYKITSIRLSKFACLESKNFINKELSKCDLGTY